jgi:hypothetical protein
MRENRPYGLEGGESGSTGLPYPYRAEKSHRLLRNRSHRLPSGGGWRVKPPPSGDRWLRSGKTHRLLRDATPDGLENGWINRFGINQVNSCVDPVKLGRRQHREVRYEREPTEHGGVEELLNARNFQTREHREPSGFPENVLRDLGTVGKRHVR